MYFSISLNAIASKCTHIEAPWQDFHFMFLIIRHAWNSDTCQCECRHRDTCTTGQYFSLDTCSCLSHVYHGQLECSNQTDVHQSPVNLYPLLVIIMAIILFLLLITSLSFTISYR